MHYFDHRIARLAQDFKTASWESVHDNRITQEDIAASLGVDQGSVSRQMSPGSDLHFPAFAVAALNDEKVKPLQHDMLVYLARHSGHIVTPRPVILKELNGTLADETVDLTAHLGRIAEMVASGRMDAKKARREIASMRSALDKADAELEVAA